MGSIKKIRGSRGHRFFITVLSVVFGVLLFWMLGFLTRDIGTMRGPDFAVVKTKHVDAELEQRRDELRDESEKIRTSIGHKKEQRGILRDSTDNLKSTIEQLLAIQKQSLAKGLEFSAESQETLGKSQSQFLSNQREYQELNALIGELTLSQQELERELGVVSKQLKEQHDLANKEQGELRKKHRMKVAVLKLSVLMPLFLVAAWFFAKKRLGTYAPIVYASFITIFIKVSLVAHEHFPSRYFKYIAIVIALGIVVKLLVYLLKRMVAPKKDWLIKQYQEAYDKYVCPVCQKPMRIGPLRYVTNLKGKKLNAAMASEGGGQETYTCPACGTGLYEKCGKCGGICHSLLPFCEHCGEERNSQITIES